jgi:hypothetical protein
MIEPATWKIRGWVLAAALGMTGCTGSIMAPGASGDSSVDLNPLPPQPVEIPYCRATRWAPVFHRLNATQYQNTVNQLLGLALPLRDELPPDSIVYGFDNGASSAMSAALTQQYMNSARTAVTAALTTPAVRSRLVPCQLTATTAAACIRTVLQAWLPKAFRRPVQPAEVDEYASYASVCTSTPDAGLSCALQAALLSPKFLFRAELLNPQAAACADSSTVVASDEGILAQHALASRLSYFLVNSAPDDALSKLASSGSLSDPQVLATQVDRLLQPNAAYRLPFIVDFPTQWMQLTALDTVRPSATSFPLFDEPLRQAMKDESQLYFAKILLENRSALELVKSDFTFVNERLATHYGIPNVKGTAMREVSTAGTHRGGLLTQGSFLTVTSSSENTSIVLRAKWVIKNLLCEDLPQPPPGVAEQVPPPDPGLGLTNRESLSIRTAGEPCHSCHKLINPIGFGLETYDPVGGLRSIDKGKTIDASGELPGGLKFQTTDQLLELLRNDPRFSACITKKLFTYALGRNVVDTCDKTALAELNKEFKADDYRLKNHLVRIIQSDLFRSAATRVEVSP